MSYYSPKREVRLNEVDEKSSSKKGILIAAGLTFVGSILIGRWIGIKLLESRQAIKSPAAIDTYVNPNAGQPPGNDFASTPSRQDITSPTLVVPPPVVEPKISQSTPSDSTDETDATIISNPKTNNPAVPVKPPPAAPVTKPMIYKVQTGIFSTVGNARELSDHLMGQGYNASFEPIKRSDGMYYRVWVGPYDNRDEAESTSQELNGAGYQAFVLEEPTK